MRLHQTKQKFWTVNGTIELHTHTHSRILFSSKNVEYWICVKAGINPDYIWLSEISQKKATNVICFHFYEAFRMNEFMESEV